MLVALQKKRTGRLGPNGCKASPGVASFEPTRRRHGVRQAAPSHPDNRSARATVEALFDALATGDSDRACGLLSAEVAWTPLALSGLTVFHGRPEVEKWLRQYGPGPGRIAVEVEQVLTIADWVVVVGIVDDNRGVPGRRCDAAWRIDVADGLVREGHGGENVVDVLTAAEQVQPERLRSR